ncbi:MAG: MEKHLA domain-containing protein, partial [Campylobacterales bacterium]|nr:MEKHLA domain-containing protein [Campylobacterales bacterium]
LSESNRVNEFNKHDGWINHSIQDEKIKALTHIAKITAADTQYKNDRQTQIYNRLHKIGKQLNATTDISLLYDMACEFTTDELKFEKCIIFKFDSTNQWFKAVRWVGYENNITQSAILEDITLLLSGRVIETLRMNKKPIIHTPNNSCDDVAPLVRSLFLQEVYMELFGGDIENVPYGVIVVGNSGQKAHAHTQMGVDEMALLALGNFTVQLSNTVDNIIYYQALIEEKKSLQKRVESRTQEIQRQKESFEAIYKTSKDGIAILNCDSNMFMDANEAYIQMTGYTKEELLTKSCKSLAVEEEQERCDKVIEEVVSKGFITNYIKTCRGKDGKKVIVNMSIALMSDKERLLMSAKDITIQKEQEEKMALMHQYTRDSIEYASMIQHSILSSQSELVEHFEDSFMIWKPKDVVGGDIVFIQALNEDEIIIMVIDCTGHGVHGAFVTMLVKGIERHIMADILYRKESVNTAKILHKFNKRMKMLLKQEKSDKTPSNAGFDGGILYYNNKHKIIKYSGAQVPLFIVEEGKCKILKGDKHSIGYIKSNVDYQFKEYSYDVSQGASIYLSSDGYLDQIGGEKRLMFGKKRFQQLLEQHWDKNFHEQEEILKEAFYQYKQNEERKDDLSVVGLKIA